MTRRDINYALSSGVIAIDKSASSPSAYVDMQSIDQRNMLVSGEYYFYNFLNSKVKLTEIWMYILESIKGEKQFKTNVPKELEERQEQLSGFSSYGDLPRSFSDQRSNSRIEVDL